jgi:hypothetical protein
MLSPGCCCPTAHRSCPRPPARACAVARTPLPPLGCTPTGPPTPLPSTVTPFKERRSSLSPLPSRSPFFELEHPTKKPNTPPPLTTSTGESQFSGAGTLPPRRISSKPHRRLPPPVRDAPPPSTGRAPPHPLFFLEMKGTSELHAVPRSTTTSSDRRCAGPPSLSSCHTTVTVSRSLPCVAQ